MAGFWDDLTKFFDGVASVTQSIEGVTGSVADNQENIARGNAAIWDGKYNRASQQLDLRAQAQDIQLEKFTTYRGDNVQFYWAVAIGAGVGLLLLK